MLVRSPAETLAENTTTCLVSIFNSVIVPCQVMGSLLCTRTYVPLRKRFLALRIQVQGLANAGVGTCAPGVADFHRMNLCTCALPTRGPNGQTRIPISDCELWKSEGRPLNRNDFIPRLQRGRDGFCHLEARKKY